MKKTDKKTDNNIRKALMGVCSFALEEYHGFKWLTHLVNYNSFPESLSIICVFDKNEELLAAINAGGDERLRKIIQEYLSSIDIVINDLKKHIVFDTEENCKVKNDGKWNERLR